MNFWINLAFYQATWLAAVTGAARDWWWAGPAMLAVFAIWQLAVSRQRRADVALMLCAAMLGILVDSAFVQTGLLAYAAPVPFAYLAPAWIVVLWMNLALTINHSLEFLKSRPALAAVFGAIGAPLAYWAAARVWHAIFFVAETATALIVLAAVWAVLAPTLFLLAQRLTLPEARP